MKCKVLTLKHHRREAPLISVLVLMILGIYTMDKLKRTDWDKYGRYKAQRGGAYIEK
jgi:hypothetical protein